MTPPPIDPKLLEQIRAQLAIHEFWADTYRKMLQALTSDTSGKVDSS